MRAHTAVPMLVVALAGCASLDPVPPKTAPAITRGPVAAAPAPENPARSTDNSPPSALARGARVRVRFDPQGGRRASFLVGTLVSLQGDTIVIAPGGLASLDTVALTAGRQLEVVTRSRGHAGQGALYGSIVGGLAGLVIASATYTPCTSTEFLGCLMYPSAGEAAGGGAILGAAGGALVGVIIGSASRTTTWAPVRTSGVRIYTTPHRFGVQIPF
jgi:hypothetical protein